MRGKHASKAKEQKEEVYGMFHAESERERVNQDIWTGINMCTTTRPVSSAHRRCIYSIKNTVKIINNYSNVNQLFFCVNMC